MQQSTPQSVPVIVASLGAVLILAWLVGKFEFLGGKFPHQPSERHRPIAGAIGLVLLMVGILLSVLPPGGLGVLDSRLPGPAREPGVEPRPPAPESPRELPTAARQGANRSSVTRVEIGPGGQELTGAGGERGPARQLADSAAHVCRLLALDQGRQVAGTEAIRWERSTAAETRAAVEDFVSRLQEAGYTGWNWSDNSLEGSRRNASGSFWGIMQGGDDGRTMLWIGCRVR